MKMVWHKAEMEHLYFGMVSGNTEQTIYQCIT